MVIEAEKRSRTRILVVTVAIGVMILGALGAATPCAIWLTKAIGPMLPFRAGVTSNNFERIVVGMTKNEVENLFGLQNVPIDDRFGLNKGHRNMRWRWDAEPDTVVIVFDLKDQVIDKEWWYNIPNESVFELMYRVVRLRPAAHSGGRTLRFEHQENDELRAQLVVSLVVLALPPGIFLVLRYSSKNGTRRELGIRQ